jgi:hypothetical protein
MDIHHNKSLRSILEDDSISLASKACIRFCSSKGMKLWLIIRPSICSFHIALYFHLNIVFLSQFDSTLTFSLFTCECFDTHFTQYPFKGNKQPHMMRSKTSYMPLFKRMGMLYESGGTPLHQEFHYKPIFT